MTNKFFDEFSQHSDEALKVALIFSTFEREFNDERYIQFKNSFRQCVPEDVRPGLVRELRKLGVEL